MSTISPDATEGFAKQLAEIGVEMLDAPVSGGEKGAIAGTLTIMVGGRKETFERCLPLFEAMGENVALVGPNGSGHRVKMVNQILCGIHIVAMNEALMFARKAGLDVNTTLRVVASGAAGSWMLTNVGPKALAGDYAPGFKIKLQQKDLRLAMESLQKLGLQSPALEHAYQQFTTALEQDLGELGHGSTHGTVPIVLPRNQIPSSRREPVGPRCLCRVLPRARPLFCTRTRRRRPTGLTRPLIDGWALAPSPVR
jgi:3-hydroxyisobutyrate dehydrogenase